MEDKDLRRRAKPLTTDEQKKIVSTMEEESQKTAAFVKVSVSIMCGVLGLLKAQMIVTHYFYGPFPHPQIFQSELEKSSSNPVMESFSSVSFFLIALFLVNWKGRWFCLAGSLTCILANTALLFLSPSRDLFSFGWYLAINIFVNALCYYFETVEKDTQKQIQSLEGFIYNLKSV